MRRLPIYFLIDVSRSMEGTRIKQVQDGLSMLVDILRQDPHALESVYISIITFAEEARETCPLTDLVNFTLPNFVPNGGTNLGDALAKASSCYERDIRKNTTSNKGDYKPLVFIMTDGEPSNEWMGDLSKFLDKKWGNVVCCGVDGANMDVLHKISEVVVQLSSSNKEAMAGFFRWVSASISAASQRIELSKPDVSLPNPFI